MKRSSLENKYNNFIQKNHFSQPIDSDKLYHIIKESISDFCRGANNPAIYCNGGHTKMLMSDFIFELKKVRYIVDNYSNTESREGSGFRVIKDEEIEKNEIDAILISSFKFRSQIKQRLYEEHPNVKILDIYQILADNGILLNSDYYYSTHPFQHYKRINQLKNKYRNIDEVWQESVVISIIEELVLIKDLKTALVWAQILSTKNPSSNNLELLSDLEDIYSEFKKSISNISKENVLMLCLDGFRRKDFNEKDFHKVYKMVTDDWLYYDNFYSYSTSTFESLIPSYSENSNQNDDNYIRNCIEEKECRFINEALIQDRQVYFYTDVEHYINSNKIHYTESFQTITEKIWSFVQDGISIDKGLFYIHSLYESHYSFCNPYTEGDFVAEGTALLFDYLPQKGGRMRTDYILQQKDSLRFLDDVLYDLLSNINCKVVLFADHGNILLPRDQKIEDIKQTKVLCDEELIQIPFAIKMNDIKEKVYHELHSLMEINEIMIKVLNNIIPDEKERKYVKCGRSEIYNPDFIFIYKKMNCAKYLKAFEAFIFDKYKLVIFKGNDKELFSLPDDEIIHNEDLKNELLQMICDSITIE
ncbi:MAG: hypothetical protein Q4D29_08350 [Lachnospiraceae bacterium]|nr:hypothetical protein [Lachnospiraceae bacterium]